MFKWMRYNIWPWSKIGLLDAKLRSALSSWDSTSADNRHLRIRIANLESEIATRESYHEQEWLKQAAVFAGVDFGYIQMLVETEERIVNSELQCARECYRRGMGYQQFPAFLALYRGHYQMFDPYQGGGNYVKR